MLEERHTPSSSAHASASTRARKRASAVEQKERRRSVITWTLSLVLGALLVNAVVGDGGYLATVRASREAAELAAEVTAVHLENQHLIAQGKRLQYDDAEIEDAARRDFGMVKPGETLIVIRDAVAAAPPTATK